MIVAHNLSKRFGKVSAVDSVNFRIPSGRVVGFLGPNGAGKTTTIRMIAGFLTPTGGCVSVDGLDVIRHARTVRRRVGYLPESTPLYTEMRVRDYLRFRTDLFAMPRRERASAIDSALQRCDLAEVARRPIGHLSKGYRQRVGLAAAIVHKPPVLILDEPTVGLDPTQIRDVRHLIRSLAGDHTIIFSTHILSEAELVCDDIIMIARGRVQAQGSVKELRESVACDRPYVLETDAADAAKAIRTVPNIAHVEVLPLQDGWSRLTVTPKKGADDRREAIGRSLQQSGALVRELNREAPSLEHLFVQIVSGSVADAAPLGANGRGGG